MKNFLLTLIDDTLKREKDGVRRFSKTALTMFSAWIAVLYSYFHHLITVGFDLTSFSIMVGVSTGMKTADALSKKLNNDNSHQ